MNMLLIRRRTIVLLAIGLVSIAPEAFADYIGGEPPPCRECGIAANRAGGNTGASLSEGSLKESLPVTTLKTSGGSTLNLGLTYNSYNADGSHARVDSVLGYGWTHTYNSLLFTQLGNIFRMDAEGRTAKFLAGPGGVYTPDPGYFDTLVKNLDGSFTFTTKDQTVYQYAFDPGTPFLIAGPVYRIQSITDRNGNTVTMTYSGGNLTAITDTYGRPLSLSYDAQNHLSQVTDPLGRVTTFTYDTGRHLTKVTDPDGKTTQYTYNTLNQMVTKKDRDGHTFTFQYQGNRPVGMKDSANGIYYNLANSGNFATSPSDPRNQAGTRLCPLPDI